LNKEEYKILELLGDSVLKLVVAELMYNGTVARSNFQKWQTNEHLIDISRILDFPEIRWDSLQGSPGRNVLAASMEIRIGKVYTAHGIESARKYITDLILHDINKEIVHYRGERYKEAVYARWSIPDHHRWITTANTPIDTSDFTEELERYYQAQITETAEA